jgi:hypothetical protein
MLHSTVLLLRSVLWIQNYFVSDPAPTLTLISDPDSVSEPDSDCL